MSTAWHIAGAKMYLHRAEAESERLALKDKLKSKFKRTRVLSLCAYQHSESRAINIEPCIDDEHQKPF